jgi:hypothetical protein
MAPGSTHLTEWRTSLASTRARALSLVTPLTPAERSTSPAPGAWSVDQVLEHLAVANALYVGSMRAALAAQGNGGAAGEWKPTFLGRLLRNSVDPSSQRKLPAPRRIVPGPTVQPGVLERFVASVDDLEALLQQAKGRDLRRIRFMSPLARFLRLNLGDGFAICAAHVARHTNQIERTIARNAGAA